jgi:ubiquinone/menaquinone biosynthesis C-methylase UbiE
MTSIPGIPPKLAAGKKPHQLYDQTDYREFWAGLSKMKLDELEHRVVKRLLPGSGRRIIDIGCGYGRLAGCYEGRFQQAVMLDGSIALLRQARDNTGGRAVYVAADIFNVPFRTGAFDAALMVRVLHHLPRPQACLSEMRRILSEDGRLVMSYSNKRNAWRIGLWLTGRTPHNPLTLEPLAVEDTFIHYHLRYVRRLMIEAGFDVSRSLGTGVLDKLAGAMGRWGRRIPPGLALAGLFGATGIAPWIFCEARARGGPALSGAEGIDDLLLCPLCRSGLAREADGYTCLCCRRRFPVEDGILDFRVG